jgi:hypothetical protein
MRASASALPGIGRLHTTGDALGPPRITHTASAKSPTPTAMSGMLSPDTSPKGVLEKIASPRSTLHRIPPVAPLA